MRSYQVIKSDILVIGSGGAGLRAAIEARENGADILLVSKSSVGRGNNTAVAGSAMAAATGWYNPEDNPDVHFADTLEAGRYINDPELVRLMTEGAEQQIYDLEKFGVEFAKDGNRFFTLDIPSHTYPRVVKPRQGIGMGLTLPLSRYAGSIGVRTMEKVFITKLLKNGDIVIGALGIDIKGEAFVFHSKSVIIASGGLCRVFERTTNMPGSTGDGYILAFDRGARLQDMEFVQFLPATLKENTRRLFLYEAFIESGALFRNALGEDIARRHGLLNPRDMTRDRIARAMMLEILEGRDIGGSVILDFSSISEERWNELEDMRSRSKSLRTLERRAYHIAPSAHFAMGGIRIDERCETGIKGLLAAGEVCGGIHGANRLGPNAITEIFVFGKIAGRTSSGNAAEATRKPLDDEEIRSELDRLDDILLLNGEDDIEDIRRSLNSIMWQKGGIVKSERGIASAMKELLMEKGRLNRSGVDSPRELWKALELRNMFVIAEMILTSARIRTESRGAHYREDYPEEDKGWLKSIVIHGLNGEIETEILTYDKQGLRDSGPI